MVLGLEKTGILPLTGLPVGETAELTQSLSALKLSITTVASAG
jgi:hypothetical protein